MEILNNNKLVINLNKILPFLFSSGLGKPLDLGLGLRLLFFSGLLSPAKFEKLVTLPGAGKGDLFTVANEVPSGAGKEDLTGALKLPPSGAGNEDLPGALKLPPSGAGNEDFPGALKLFPSGAGKPLPGGGRRPNPVPGAGIFQSG